MMAGVGTGTGGLPTPTLSGDDLVGTWHIVRTTFPMWTGGRNLAPTLHYARLPGVDSHRLDDRVTYRRGAKTKQISGVDEQDPAQPNHFRWRGRGLLALLRSDWYVVDLDREAGVLAIYFSKTLVTPEGLDLATRAAEPEPAPLAACVARLRAWPALHPQLDGLVEIHHRLSR